MANAWRLTLGPVDGYDIESGAQLSQRGLFQQRPRQAREAGPLAVIDAKFWPTFGIGARLHFNDDDRAAIGCHHDEVGLIVSDAKIAGEFLEPKPPQVIGRTRLTAYAQC